MTAIFELDQESFIYGTENSPGCLEEDMGSHLLGESVKMVFKITDCTTARILVIYFIGIRLYLTVYLDVRLTTS